MVFVDTSAWFALFVPTDPDHERVRLCFEALEQPVITTDYIADETLTLLTRRNELTRALEAGRAIFELDIARLHFLTPDQTRRAWIQFQQRQASGWSFTDCTSRVVIGELHITTALALDRHFNQFGITVVP